MLLEVERNLSVLISPITSSKTVVATDRRMGMLA
ncbi:hypothetical protein V6Z12_A09G202800 [Gossypium hirsutum]